MWQFPESAQHAVSSRLLANIVTYTLLKSFILCIFIFCQITLLVSAGQDESDDNMIVFFSMDVKIV